MAQNTKNNSQKKSTLASFKYKLQDRISLDDKEWKYQVPGLPSPQKLDEHRLVKTVSLINSATKSEIVLSLEPTQDNRAIHYDPLNKFVVVSLAEFKHIPQQQLQNSMNSRDALQPITPRECNDYAIRFLKAGIHIQGVHYNFYGHSNSQLKSRTCFLYAASREQISHKVKSLGDFSSMKTVAKMAKRIGLLFSTARVAKVIPPDRVEDIPDIESPDGYVFTDGCGLISPHLAQDLARRLGIVFRDRRYTPSVLQIRYRGYKGVVTVDPRMTSDPRILLRMRKSMKKFSGGDDHSFSVVEYSKPFTYGFLNDEVIVLLNALGVDREIIKKKQDNHFKFLADASRDPRSAFRFLSGLNMPDLAESVLVESFDAIRPRIRSLVKNEYAKMLNKREEQKCRILIPKSRLLFGVCDAWGVLKEGECAVKITLEENGLPMALKNCEVLVTRNPCLHPGDLQKFRVVERPELSHLVDCIVFSTKGKRPAADMMSGGDLDGDTFFVCWDLDLIPKTLSQPAKYPGVKEPIRFTPITDDDRLEFFVRYTNASLGRVKNLYLDWARAGGPMSPECQELNRLFSQCVDGNRIKIPPRLEKAPSPPSDAPPFILDELHEAAKRLIQQEQFSNQEETLDGYDLDAVELLMSRDGVAMSEFEMVCMTLRWCRKENLPFEDFLHLFDLNVLTSQEKAWLMQQLPPMAWIPGLVLNAVSSSSLLDRESAARFKLDHPRIQWKRIYDSSRDRLATFMDVANRSMALFHRKLLIVRVDDRLTLAIYVPRIIDPARDCLVDDTVRLFAFSHSQGTERQSRMSLPTKITYRLYCDGNTFQLFEAKRSNTWIFITRGPSDDSSYRDVQNLGDRRRQRQKTLDEGTNAEFRVSIALDKFSRGLQRHVGRVNRNKLSAAEIYIISNRDVASMQVLDLWLEHIDTESVLPLFPREAEEYTLPSLKDVDWAAEFDVIVEVAHRQNFAALEDVESINELETLFYWLLERDQAQLLLQSYDYLLSSMRESREFKLPLLSLLSSMVAFLKAAPYLAISFGKIKPPGPDDEDLEALNYLLNGYSLDILRALVLSANEAQDLVIAPFKTFLSRVRGLTFESFSSLVELISLTVRRADLAMDLLLECLDRESTRLLSGRPALIQHFVRNSISIALEHIGEATEQGKSRKDLLKLKRLPEDRDGYPVVEIEFRIDSDIGTPENAAHVRLTVATLPANTLSTKKYSIDALVIHSELGRARFQCLHPLPLFYEKCSWKLRYCGPYTTTKTMLNAVLDFARYFDACCQVADLVLLGRDEITKSSRTFPRIKTTQSELSNRPHLNPSQNAAIEAALNSSLTCLWGPPGTGKTETIVEIIRALQTSFEGSRLLITAPTHNAVDNVMRRYIGRLASTGLADDPSLAPLRVSTEIRKVSKDLWKYTCDAHVGQEVYSGRKVLDEAKRRVQESKIVFTTCIGAGIGLLRSETFDIVIIDEASQQTEPASLVPLVKGCQRAVLVGDHVQLRPTVHPNSLVMEFDKSLFERLFVEDSTSSKSLDTKSQSIARLMLDIQYRMHPFICAFSSKEFYNGKLQTGIPRSFRPLPNSQFPWPLSRDGEGDKARMVFVECATREDLGGKSKTNKGQADLCLRICEMLCTRPGEGKHDSGQEKQSELKQLIAVLTPYARQAELLKQLLSPFASRGVEVSSIDGFQGREADIVVLVTVRCNESREIGFLKDVRRMNVALTRARSGVVIIGNRETLTGTRRMLNNERVNPGLEGAKGDDRQEAEEINGKWLWKRLLESLVSIRIEIESQVTAV